MIDLYAKPPRQQSALIFHRSGVCVRSDRLPSAMLPNVCRHVHATGRSALQESSALLVLFLGRVYRPGT